MPYWHTRQVNRSSPLFIRNGWVIGLGYNFNSLGLILLFINFLKLSAENTEIQTRSATEVWLVGQVAAKLAGLKLPTSRHVLSVFFHQHKTLKLSVRDSARFAVREVLSLWTMAHIPKTIERNAVEKLEQLFDKWIKMKN